MQKSFKNSTGALRFTLTNDFLFHIVFQQNMEILRGLLCCLLGLKPEQIISIVLENPIDPHDHIDDKEVILDLIIILNNQQKINIEMQVVNGKDWPERSLTYLCRSFDNLKHGQNYLDVMPTIHIGILDFTLFPEYPEFYAHYAMMNTKNHNIYSDKFLLNVLDLNQIHLATPEDIQCGLQRWAKLFKATTWEEIKMLATTDKTFENVANTMHRALSDAEIRLKCEARERYERDRISLYASGHQEGLKEGIEKGIEKGSQTERISTIKKLTTKGMSAADIANLLDIPLTEVESMIVK